MTETIRPSSPDGLREVTVAVLAEEGPFCVARGVDFRPGKNGAVRRVWVVYHTKTGCGFRGDWTTLEGATEAMKQFAKIEGNWDRPLSELKMDKTLRRRVEEVYKSIVCSALGDSMAEEEDE